MPFDAPMTLGPFTVDHTGRLRPDPAAAVPSFRVAWRDRVVHVAMRLVRPDLAMLTLRITLGRIPSTAPSGAMDERDTAFATLRRLPTAVLHGWDVGLSADHRILLQTEAELALPASAASLVTEMTLFLLTVDPYLTLLEEAGLGLPPDFSPKPGARGGSAKT